MEIICEKGKEPPKMLADLITKTILVEEGDEKSKPITLVETVEFVVNQLKDSMLAAFSPKAKRLMIDLGNCLVNQNFMKQGLMWIPSIWFNLLFAFYHEMAHVIQIEEDPKLAKRKEPTKAMEKDANDFAIGSIKDWTKDKNNEMPTLNEMGWIGKQVKKGINLYYPEPLFDTMISEIKPYELGAVGGLNTIAAHQKEVGEIHEQLSKDEKFGVTVDGIKYMKAEEFFGAIYSEV